VMEEIVHASNAAMSRTPRILLRLVCAVACALFVAGAIGFYFGRPFGNLFNSDAAVPALLASEILHTGHPVPASWYFANDEIWTLAPHVFALPFVAALGVSTLALKLGNLLCLGVMVLFLTLAMHRVTGSWPYSIVVATGAFAAFSGFQEMGVYMQTAYGWFCAEFAILIYLALRIQAEMGSEQWRFPRGAPWTTAIYALLLVNLAIESPLRTAVYWVAPLVFVALVFPLSKARSRSLAAWTIATFLAGVVLHMLISTHALTQAGTTARLLNPFGEWGTTLSTIARGLPVVIGYAQPGYGAPLDFLGGLRLCFFTIAVFVVLLAPVGNGIGSAECRFFARVSGAILLFVFAALMVGRLVSDPASDRYLIPPALLCLAAFMAILWCRFRTRIYSIAAIAALFVVAFCGSAAMLISRQGPVAFGRDCEAPSEICRLAGALAKIGVGRGYATYWNGNATTLASGGAIRVCGVILTPQIAPFRWLVSKDCFAPPSDDRYFLALDQSEIEKFGREFLIAQAGTPENMVTDGQYEVWIYATAKANLDWLRR
jgi:hypothetical protein